MKNKRLIEETKKYSANSNKERFERSDCCERKVKVKKKLLQ